MEKRDFKLNLQQTEEEKERKQSFFRQFRAAPLPDDELLRNVGLFMNRQTLMRILFFDELYQRILDVPGSVAEFGVRWGQNLALFSNFRGIYEPYNMSRRIIGFDTFEGFLAKNEKDGDSESVRTGAYGVSSGYESYLDRVLQYHESESPLAHIRRYSLIKGDVVETLPLFLRENPATILALAFFDLDLFEPTAQALKLIRPHLTRGSILAFDQLNCGSFPGETLAVMETLGLGRHRLFRSRYSTFQSYLVME